MRVAQRIGRAVAGVLGRESRLVRAVRPAYERGLNALARGRGIPWSINGAACRIDARYRCQLGQRYDAPVAEFLRPRVRPGQTCLDVGANVGAWVLQFANWVGPAGRVVAFEPNPTTMDVLRAHVRMSGFDDRVALVPAAVGATAGAARFHAAGTDGMSRLGEPNPAVRGPSVEITVPVVALTEFCRAERLRPDWVLIDVEGYEGAVLAGAADLIRERGPDLGLVVEMHPSAWASADFPAGRLADLIRSLGRTPVPLAGQSDPLAEYGLVHLAPTA